MCAHVEPEKSAEEIFTRPLISASALIDQRNEYFAVVQAGTACKLFSELEVNYWWRLWDLAEGVVLSESAQANFAKTKLGQRALDQAQVRYEYFLKAGCASPELTTKIRDMKKRMRLAGLSLKQLEDSNAAAPADLYRNGGE